PGALQPGRGVSWGRLLAAVLCTPAVAAARADLTAAVEVVPAVRAPATDAPQQLAHLPELVVRLSAARSAPPAMTAEEVAVAWRHHEIDVADVDLLARGYRRSRLTLHCSTSRSSSAQTCADQASTCAASCWRSPTAAARARHQANSRPA